MKEVVVRVNESVRVNEEERGWTRIDEEREYARVNEDG